MGWPDQAMLDFFIAVWKVNQGLAVDKRLRIVLADVPKPWREVSVLAWGHCERPSGGEHMSDHILRDLQEHGGDKRSALFIVGAGHATRNCKYYEGSPVTGACWYLCRGLGAEQVFSIFPHMPSMDDWGTLRGRLRMGLFDSAFAATGDRPVCLPLRTGPFGQEPFDAMELLPVDSTYADAYDAYLYLGPVKEELFSPLIEGFYTEADVSVIDRTFRSLNPNSWAEYYQRPLNLANFVALLKETWGQPRRRWDERRLGPVDAWKRGA